MKLALGTAQFGMDYGVTNQSGQPHASEVKAVLDYASATNIDMLDTAKAYGCSEAVLGDALGGHGRFQYITKLPKLDFRNVKQPLNIQIQEGFNDSIQKLRVKTIYALLLHDANDLLQSESDEVYHALARVKQEGLVCKIGVSAYSPGVVEEIISRYPIDIVQIPFNLLDQRAESSGLFRLLHAKNVEVHVRSAFLQGVLLEDKARLPERFSAIDKQLTILDEVANSLNTSKMAVALDFLKKHAAIDKVIVGVLSEQQLRECVSAYQHDIKACVDYQSMMCSDRSVIDPRCWQ